MICAGARGARSIKFGAPRGNGKERARPFGRTGFSSYIMRAHDFLLYGHSCALLIEKTHASPSSRASCRHRAARHPEEACFSVIRKKCAPPSSSGRNALPHRHPERSAAQPKDLLQRQKRAFRFGRARFAKRKAQTHPRRAHSAREPENGAQRSRRISCKGKNKRFASGERDLQSAKRKRIRVGHTAPASPKTEPHKTQRSRRISGLPRRRPLPHSKRSLPCGKPLLHYR